MAKRRLKAKPRGPTGSPTRRADARRAKAKEAEDDAAPKLDIPLPKQGEIGSLDYWTNEVDLAVRRRKKEISSWRNNLDRAYRNKKSELYSLRLNETIIVPTDFYNVEQKKGQLFFKTPYVQLTSERPETEQAAPFFQHVLNYLLGSKEANVKRTVSTALIDVLCAAGIGPTEIGYECQKAEVQMPTGRMVDAIDPDTKMPVFEPDPVLPNATRVKQTLALGDDGKPETAPVEKTIWERYFWKRFSPAKFLIPVGFLSTEWDDAPWLGREFDPDHDLISEDLHVGSGALGDYPDEHSLAPQADRDFMKTTGRGVVIYYRANVYDRAAHPELYRKLILVAGKRRDWIAAYHNDVEYQKFDPVTLRFVQGMKGNPIHPLSIRIVTDQAYVPSDCTVARPTADEMSIGRSQMIKQRTRNIPIRGINTSTIPKEVVARIERGDYQALIPFTRAITKNDFFELAQAQFPHENFNFDSIIRRDLELIWGLGANQLGQVSERGITATESAEMAGNASKRMEDDRNAVLEWFISGVEKFAALPQVYGDHERLVEVEGATGAARIQTWNKDQIQGRYGFSIRPDSSERLNAAENRELQLRFNNLVQNNPYFNQFEIAKDTARAFNRDPNKVTQQPPPPPQEKPKLSISLKGDDLNPMMPQYPNVLVILAANGMDPATMKPAEAPEAPPGPAHTVKSLPPGEPIDKHDAALTGRLPGPGPM